MTTAIIDGDIIVHRASSGQQVNVRWDDDGPASSAVDTQKACSAAVELTEQWASAARCKDMLVCLSGSHNFRKVIMPSYKANRAGKAKPLAFTAAKQAVAEAFPTRLVEGLEADDLMGILATSDNYRDAVIVTLDKDLRTVPGRHFNPLKPTAKPFVVTPALAQRAWLLQVLTGDPVDGYYGIRGVGPSKAAKILDEPAPSGDLGTLWGRIERAYQKAGMTRQDAILHAQVARILQRNDYDKESKCLTLWHPNTPVRYPLELVLAGETPGGATPPFATTLTPRACG